MRWFTRLPRLLLAACFALGIALGVNVWLVGTASAHASYESSDPEAGAVLSTAPTQVTVHFEQNVNPLGADGVPSSLAVYLNEDLENTNYADQDATLVSTGETQFPSDDAKTMTIAMEGAGNGIYEVYWHTVSADDGEADSGVFFFAVGTSIGQGLVVTAPQTPASNTSSGTPIWVTVLAGIIGLVLGGGIVAAVRRRSPSPAAASQANAPSPGETPAEKR